jgi:formylglycine-generating enzyme required for sulfatase activity
MKKYVLSLFIAILVTMLSGCILSKTPSAKNVSMSCGEVMTFSITVLGNDDTITWILDGVPVLSADLSYTYTALAGEHTLVVKAKYAFGYDTRTWHILANCPPNDPPTADAGPDQTVAENVLVTLDASYSTDQDDGIASYLWEQISGPPVTLASANTCMTTFTADVPSGSLLTFRLTVTDMGGLTSTDTCVIKVFSAPIVGLLGSMVQIPAGSFMMGSTDNEYEYAVYTTPVHQVTLQAFDIGAYEVTQAQYLTVMGINPSWFQAVNGYPGHENNPVDKVTWYQAQEFCTALSALTGRTFTLPSEAQWEYACRAGTTTLYSYGDSDALLGNYAWWWLNSDGTGGPYGTHPVGTKLPNAWGLYDMHGNVWELCQDSWHENYTGAPTDGSAWEPETGSLRILRGGCWVHTNPGNFRSASRNSPAPDFLFYGIGFRVVEVR